MAPQKPQQQTGKRDPTTEELENFDLYMPWRVIVDLTTLSVQNLSAVKQQLDDELEHLSNSFAKLRAAQTKFRECIKSIESGVQDSLQGKPILVPLTTSLYVTGQLADTSKVIVDVGTGYYVEKTRENAKKFYAAKVDDLSNNLSSLEKVIAQKGQNVRIVEDVLRQKVLAGKT